MNKSNLIIFIMLVMLLLSSCKTFSGYYYSLDDARTEDQYAKYYEGENSIFSKELSGGVIDFIIDGDYLHIVCIIKSTEANKTLFQIKTVTSFILDEQIQNFYDNKQYNFRNSTKLATLKYSWCIVTKQYNESNNNFNSFEFEHNNQFYHLCIKL